MKSVVVTDAARGIGALVADALARMSLAVGSLSQRPSESHTQEAAAWLDLFTELEPDAVFVSHLRVRGSGLSRAAVQTAEAAFAAAARCPSLEKVVVLSSGQVYGARDDLPTFVPEHIAPDRDAPTSAGLLEVEAAASAFARARPDTVVTILRPTEVLGPYPHGLLADHIVSSGSFVTASAGFDPQVQFATDHDVAVAALLAIFEDRPGVYNIAPADALRLSSAIRVAAKFRVGVNRAVTRVAGAVLRTEPWSGELSSLMRFGRCLDATRSVEGGFAPLTASADAIRGWRAAQEDSNGVGEPAGPDGRGTPTSGVGSRGADGPLETERATDDE